MKQKSRLMALRLMKNTAPFITHRSHFLITLSNVKFPTHIWRQNKLNYFKFTYTATAFRLQKHFILLTFNILHNNINRYIEIDDQT